jgi:5'-nucleotidase
LVGGAGALALVAGLVVGLPTAAQAAAGTGPVVINEVYGGGGNAGATYLHDFVELVNTSTGPVDLAGWSVQYAAATGATYQVTALSLVLPAGASYVVREAAGASTTATPVTGDATGTIAMSGTAGKVALVSSTTALTCAADCDSAAGVVDFVGYGATANDFEGTGPTAAPSNTLSVSRNSTHDDTGSNAADFTAGAPTPTACGSACSPPDAAPRVTSTTPADGAGGVDAAANDVV